MTKIIIVSALVLAACHGEERRFSLPAATSGLESTPQTEATDWEANAWGLSEGKRLFAWFNCTGCHFHGGGGMGPPLMDERWTYGSSPASIHESISKGRPNGMPAFEHRIPDAEIWQLAAYVRSMAGLVPAAAAPGRDDDLLPHKPEAMTPAATPVEEPNP